MLKSCYIDNEAGYNSNFQLIGENITIDFNTLSNCYAIHHALWNRASNELIFENLNATNQEVSLTSAYGLCATAANPDNNTMRFMRSYNNTGVLSLFRFESTSPGNLSFCIFLSSRTATYLFATTGSNVKHRISDVFVYRCPKIITVFQRSSGATPYAEYELTRCITDLSSTLFASGTTIDCSFDQNYNNTAVGEEQRDFCAKALTESYLCTCEKFKYFSMMNFMPLIGVIIIM